MLKKIFNIGSRTPSAEIEELARLAGEKAEYYFESRRLSCSEASLLVLNRVFGGEMTDEQAISLGCGFGGGIGGSGCACGAISGAVMALGLFLGTGKKGAPSKKRLRKLVGEFHDRFREVSGSVCCRDLIADFRKDRKVRSAFCRGLTGRCTSDAFLVILKERPHLTTNIDVEFLKVQGAGGG